MITIAGLKQPDALAALGISRGTLYAYRQDPHWPGDDADLALLRAWVGAKKRPAGRKPASPPSPSVPVSAGDVIVADPELSELQAALSLDEEMKRVLIEKNKVLIAQYQRRFSEAFRNAFIAAFIREHIDPLFDDIADLGLTPTQLTNLRARIVHRRNLLIAAAPVPPLQPVLFDDAPSSPVTAPGPSCPAPAPAPAPSSPVTAGHCPAPSSPVTAPGHSCPAPAAPPIPSLFP